MRQTVAIKVYLEFDIEQALDELDAEEVLSNVKQALESWAESSETGLCPYALGYTKDITVFLSQIYRPEG